MGRGKLEREEKGGARCALTAAAGLGRDAGHPAMGQESVFGFPCLVLNWKRRKESSYRSGPGHWGRWLADGCLHLSGQSLSFCVVWPLCFCVFGSSIPTSSPDSPIRKIWVGKGRERRRGEDGDTEGSHVSWNHLGTQVSSSSADPTLESSACFVSYLVPRKEVP